jgi:hypothetical protein
MQQSINQKSYPHNNLLGISRLWYILSLIMKMLAYLPTYDLYITPDGSTYTDIELDELERMENEWKESLEKELPRTLKGWVEVFMEDNPKKKISEKEKQQGIKTMLKAAHRGLKEKLKKYKQRIRELGNEQDEHYEKRIMPAPFKDQVELKEESDKEFDEKRKEVDGRIRKVTFEMSFLNELEGIEEEVKTGSGISETDIARAKEVPLETFFPGNLRKHGKMAVCQCPFHSERTGSFTIYLEQNSWWCYGCQNGGSVVDFIMKQNGVDFLTAVKQLLK